MKLTRATRLILSAFLVLLSNALLRNAQADDYADVSQLVRAAKYPEALSKADLFLSTQPKDAQMRFLKGVIQRESGKTSDAITTFSRLTEDYPELPEPYNNLAVLYAGQGQYDKARNALEAAIRTNPSYSTAHENLGDVYAKLASQAYNKALQLDNNNVAVVPKLALIHELFSPTGAKAQRPGLLAPTVAHAPQIAAVAPNKGAAAAPQLPAQKQSPVMPAPAPAGNATPPVANQQANTTPPPVVTAPVTPAATSTTAATAAAGSSAKDVEAVVKAWAAAWSARDVKTYLSLYGKDFTPPAGMSRASWEEERRLRISSKASISVRLDNLVVSVSTTKASVKFKQDYKANGLAVSSRKILELSKVGEHWKIVKESIAN